jgi:hypothetical protein
VSQRLKRLFPEFAAIEDIADRIGVPYEERDRPPFYWSNSYNPRRGRLIRLAQQLYDRSGFEPFLQIIEFDIELAAAMRIGELDIETGVKKSRAARDALALVAERYPRLQSFLRAWDAQIDKTRRMARKEIVRRLLHCEIEPERAREMLGMLVFDVEEGYWPQWQEDWPEWRTNVEEIQRRWVA